MKFHFPETPSFSPYRTDAVRASSASRIRSAHLSENSATAGAGRTFHPMPPASRHRECGPRRAAHGPVRAPSRTPVIPRHRRHATVRWPGLPGIRVPHRAAAIFREGLPHDIRRRGTGRPGGLSLRRRMTNQGALWFDAPAVNSSHVRHAIWTPADWYAWSVSDLARDTTDSLTPPRLQIATFIFRPAASKFTEQIAVIGIALISGLLTEALDPLQGVRFALTRDIPFPQTPSGIKNNGLAGFRADHWPVTPLGDGRGRLPGRTAPPGGTRIAPHRPLPDTQGTAGEIPSRRRRWSTRPT